MANQTAPQTPSRTAGPGATARPTVSVVIPSYNPGEDIGRCLESVLAQETGASYEVIVVDSSDVDLTGAWCAAFPTVRFVRLDERAFPGTARNVGAHAAAGEYVAFTDTDCVADSGWVEELWQAHQLGYQVVGGSVANGTPDSSIGTAEYLLEFNEVNPWMRPREVLALPSCNLSVRKGVFDECGYLEDVEKGSDTLFCAKVASHGIKLYFTPDARVTHRNRRERQRYLDNQRALGRGSAGIRRKTDRPGAFLTRVPILIPLIPALRSVAIARRLLRSRVRLFVRFCRHYPLVFAGLWAYTAGFWEGCRQRK